MIKYWQKERKLPFKAWGLEFEEKRVDKKMEIEVIIQSSGYGAHGREKSEITACGGLFLILLKPHLIKPN